MRLVISNINYAATVVEIKILNPIKGLDNLQQAMIFGNSVLVGKETCVGDMGLFFPLETALSQEFLSNNNLYKDKLLNKDQEKKGYFEQHGRIRAVKFKGVPSEGFFIPLISIMYALNSTCTLNVGDEFNEIEGHQVCHKYIPKSNRTSGEANSKNKQAVKTSRLVEGQFRLHYETAQLRKNMESIHPDSIISISKKIHGTSWVVARVLAKRPMEWYEKILNKLLKIPITITEYDSIYSSRKVIKNGFINANPSHFYKYDLWSDIKDRVWESIPNGFSLYGEAVGFLPGGGCIQDGYSYGAKENTFDIYVYRVTFTNNQGKVFELTWEQMKEFCLQRGLNTVKEFHRGKAKDVFPNLMSKEEADATYCDSATLTIPYTPGVRTYKNVSEWRDAFLSELIECKAFDMGDVMDKDCNYLVPAEGIVVRLDGLNESTAFKLKNFRFLSYETDQLDKGTLDTESQDSATDDESIAEEGV